jgi:methylated-DNA-protein-cysteine methyltransferase-like protein
MPRSTFTECVIEIIREIPEGKVATYGGIAAQAGNARAARQVVRVLHTCTNQENLPWWRVVNREGRIALKAGNGFEEQEDLLLAEGVAFLKTGRVDLERHLSDLD